MGVFVGPTTWLIPIRHKYMLCVSGSMVLGKVLSTASRLTSACELLTLQLYSPKWLLTTVFLRLTYDPT